MPNDFILLTIHRAKNTDDPVRLKNIVDAVKSLSEKRFVFPVHPRTKKIPAEYGLHFGSHVTLIEPVGYLEMLKYEEACTAVLTDSGGVQKEAFFFQKPCITMCETTEWVELVTSGWNTLTGDDAGKIISAIQGVHASADYP